MLAMVTYAYRTRKDPAVDAAEVIRRVTGILMDKRWAYVFRWSAALVQVDDEVDYRELMERLEEYRKETSAHSDGSDGAFDFFGLILRDPQQWDFYPDSAALPSRSDWKEKAHLLKLDNV